MVSPSILSADFGCLEREFERLNRSEADLVHLDVMDGVFVPNISFGFPVIQAMARLSTKPLDVHLMIAHPEQYVDRFCELHPYSVGFHLEAVQDPMPAIEAIHSHGCRACLTINPDIDITRLYPYLDKVDIVMLMSVYAGYGGQKFIPESLDRIRAVRAEIQRRGLSTLIEVDGGVTLDNYRDVYAAGADIIVAGTAVFRAPDFHEAIRTLRTY